MRKKDKLALELMNERLRKLEVEMGLNTTAIEDIFGIAKGILDEVSDLGTKVANREADHPFGPEPPVWSIVRGEGHAMQRTPSGWWHISDPFSRHEEPDSWAEVNEWFGPLEILYWAEEGETHPWCKPKNVES